ncbi:Beta-glucan synthesis-associated protein [Phytophthora megakarya]|uniref:Beta-glucan synthesis-associated protein n=1 Tax=Phytophthora megakarya TaxID=4795 RepID=A0A225VWY4_9STRA|nr:Beta-glucan synthesis-associated protein [Phytophthora megakarya]
MQLVPYTQWGMLMAMAMSVTSAATTPSTYPTKSGIGTWVDPATPSDRQTYTSSRGRKWDLVMSDEFNVANRSFRPGDDHMWTSLEKPDGVNGAMELYSHNMTSTECDDDGTCYFYIESIDEVNAIRVYNMYTHPPSFTNVSFFYRAAMVQSWNKFCYQGGMLEVRAQLPGAVSKASGNPDLALGRSGKVATNQYYPTWPGIWMMGNLGRSIFSASTNRMWPFSYNKCEPDVFEPSNQRISACDSNPGYGLNPNQGRGAPEIDVLEGGGLAISSSLQIAPGMPDDYHDYRLFPVNTSTGDFAYCIYSYTCQTPGANYLDVPTAYYQQQRGHKSWYQNLRYASNNLCKQNATLSQNYSSVAASLKAGITENTCSLSTCPASGDVHAELSLIDGERGNYWGINSNGTCYPVINSYMGSYLCDPDNMNSKCASPRNSSTPKSNAMKPFNYQMDAISSNWPVHLGAYLDFVTYQLEWVTGKNGYVRWMLHGSPLFEVAASSITDIPQNSKKTNIQKTMLEEPMYIIFNVALSATWGAKPPNPGQECRGDGKDPVTNKICDSFPMYMKIDYIRLYQDLASDLDSDNYMQVGCDPKSHPTKEWIDGHIDEYEDNDNKWEEVRGKAFCNTNDDCTIGTKSGKVSFNTGKCQDSRCVCSYKSWGGPRCTTAVSSTSNSSGKIFSSDAYGPSLGAALIIALVVVLLSMVSIYAAVIRKRYATKNYERAGVEVVTNGNDNPQQAK